MSETAAEVGLPLRAQDEVECRHCDVHCEKVIYPGSCLRMACPFVYAYEAWGRTYMGCMQKVFDVEIDLSLLEAAEAERGGFGAVRARRAPLPMCDVEVISTLRRPGGRPRLPQPGVPRAPARARELPRLRARHRRRSELASPSPAAWRLLSVARRARADVHVGGAEPTLGHVSRSAGSSRNAGWPRKVASPSPSTPLRRRRGGRGSSRAASCASLTWSTRSRSSPIRESRSRRAHVESLGVGDVDSGRPPVARVEADARAVGARRARRRARQARRPSGRSSRPHRRRSRGRARGRPSSARGAREVPESPPSPPRRSRSRGASRRGRRPSRRRSPGRSPSSPQSASNDFERISSSRLARFTR